MTTIEKTVSMMEKMPEEMRIKVFLFAEELAGRQKNPFVPLTKDQILSDLAISRKQHEEGQSVDAATAITEMRRRHGFI